MKKKYFSLIEVVLACTVLILFSLAGIIIFSGAVRGVTTSKYYTQATMIGNEALERARYERDNAFLQGSLSLPSTTMPQTCYDSSLNGVVCTDSKAFFTVDLTSSSLVYNGKKYTATVKWNSYGVQKSLTLYTYLFPWQAA